jgi:hypothetical protein
MSWTDDAIVSDGTATIAGDAPSGPWESDPIATATEDSPPTWESLGFPSRANQIQADEQAAGEAGMSVYDMNLKRAADADQESRGAISRSLPGRMARGVASAVADAYVNPLLMAENALGFETAGDMLQERQAQADMRGHSQESWTERTASGIVNSLAQAGSLGAPSAFAKLPSLGAIITSAVSRTYADTHRQMLKENKTPEEAAKIARASAAIEGGVTAAFQMAGLGGMEAMFFKGAAWNGVKRFGLQTLHEVGEEEIITAATEFATKGNAGDPQAYIDTAIQAIGGVGLMGGAQKLQQFVTTPSRRTAKEAGVDEIAPNHKARKELAAKFENALTAKQFKEQLTAVATSPEEADALYKLVEARAESAGETLDEYVGSRIKGVEKASWAETLAQRESMGQDPWTGKPLAQSSAQTDTPAFKKWFGESKVVDRDGAPRRVYHGTRSDFPEFDTSNRGFSEDVANQLGDNIGTFFTTRASTASDFAERGKKDGVRPSVSDINNDVPTEGANVRPVHLALQNPAVFKSQEEWRSFNRTNKNPREALEGRGHDGVEIRGVKYGPKTERWYIAFSPTQIKSAIGNRGTFSPDDPSILGQPAYHGSPYKFDKFTTEKIGTGEGAQAYGWGLYFAGNESVAKFYRDKLSDNKTATHKALTGYFVPGQVVPGYGGHDRVLSFKWNDGNWGVSVQRVTQQNGEWVDAPGERPRTHSTQPTATEMRKAGIDPDIGALYKVDLKPTDEELLDWDKPLSEQSEGVKKAIERATGINTATREVSGREAYHRIAATNGLGTEDFDGDRGASKLLHSLGIRGIKYKDQGSRNTEGGSHNFVIFDDADVAIEEILAQKKGKVRRGEFEPLKDGRAIIRAFTEAQDISTLAHELGHLFRRDLDGNARAFAEKWAGVKDGKWDRDAEEKFARGFERYLRTGRAPTPSLKNVFEKFKGWLTNVYKSVRGTPLDVNFNKEMRGVYDSLFLPQGQNAKPAVAPAGKQAPAVTPPAPAPSTIRFYHGGTDYDGGKRWLSEDKAYAERYARNSGGKLHYVDVPSDSPFLANVNKQFDDSGTDQRAPYVHFEAPDELAAQLQSFDESQTTSINNTERSNTEQTEYDPPEAPPTAHSDINLDAIPEDASVIIKAIRGRTGEEVSMRRNAREAITEIDDDISLYKKLMGCLSR